MSGCGVKCDGVRWDGGCEVGVVGCSVGGMKVRSEVGWCEV